MPRRLSILGAGREAKDESANRAAFRGESGAEEVRIKK
jgi:hypothetical protein